MKNVDYTKIVLAAISAICTGLGLFGIITTEEATTLASSGSSAALSVSGLVLLIVKIVKDHKKAKTPEVGGPVEAGTPGPPELEV